jgi:hypothetical protein
MAANYTDRDITNVSVIQGRREVIGGENLYQIKCKKGVFQGQLENIFR